MKKYNLDDIKTGWQNNETADSYDEKRFSNVFGKISDSLDKLSIKRALSKIDKTGAILDLPCGTGRVMNYLYNAGYKNITGADISEQMLSVAKKKMANHQEVSFHKTEAENTKFPNNHFDAILSVRFMGHLPKETRIEILREFRRLCAGPIVIEYPIKNQFSHGLKSLLSSLTMRDRLPNQWEWYDLSKKELEEELREAGLRINTMIKKLPFLSESIYVIAKKF